jgi:hypothetical protein
MKRILSSPQVRDHHRGPNLMVLTLIYLAFLLLGGSKVSASFHIPLDSVDKAVGFVTANSGAIKWGSFFELASAIPLAIFIATATSRLRFLKVRSAAESIALLGGIIASTMLILSALSTWSITRPGISGSAGAVRALQALGFLGGGPGFVVPLGLFFAGVSLAAGLHKLVPQWVMWLGVFVAIVCELASLTLLNFKAGYLSPVGGFVGIIWMIALSLSLPRGRPAPLATQDLI